MFEFLLCDDHGDAVLREWLRERPAYYVTAKPVEPSPVSWTVVDTATSSDSSAHLMAWVGDVPLLLDGFESSHITHGLRILASTPARLPKK